MILVATVTDDLIREGNDILAKQSPEEMHSFGDRILSVEADNWYGLFMRGCAFALDGDLNNSVKNLKECAENVEDETVMADLGVRMAECLSKCYLATPAGAQLDFSAVAGFLNAVNDKLPESEDEFMVNAIFEGGFKLLKEREPVNRVITYLMYKATCITAFRAYVELPIFIGFFGKLKALAEELKPICEPKEAEFLDADQVFVDELLAAMTTAVDTCPPEQLELIEEYWLEHKTDVYVGHLLQAYQMSQAVASGRRFMSKMAGKVMLGCIQNFIKAYLSPKV